ncbi:hypothetical protein Tsubulata_038077 [Turnera subulata]|uniref:Uncharacterized protein n=1 Tax=Turnera subulata TaxID=218843 RepID=A0A9Q0GDI8_9ROSI|nr:hypothetical protein Tsubulata_038077 [Turnera subulata]
MANPERTRALAVTLVVVFMIFVRVSEEARATPAAMAGFNRELLLSRVLNAAKSDARLHYYQRISTPNTGTDRASPGGPDPEHHLHFPRDP